jgi:hypothetical protein
VVAASAEDFGTCFTHKDQKQTELLKILNDVHAPYYVFKLINDRARWARMEWYGFNPVHRTRGEKVRYMEKWQNLEKCHPFQIPTTFPEDGLSINITA